MQYSELTINQRINLKGTYESFLQIAIQKFRKEQDRKIYLTGRRGLKRSKNLYKSFGSNYTMGASGVDVLKINFLLYGRFIDMGVGSGSNVNHAALRRRYREHRAEIKRKPIRWYSKRKSTEEKRLSEILAQRYKMGLIHLAESALNNTITIPM